jgi:tetratricopeptide (TPR) repeat protein
LLLAEKLTNNQNHMKITVLKTIVTIVLTGVISLTATGQDKKILKMQKEIDSLFYKYENDNSINGLRNHHYRFKKSQSIPYYNGMLDSYLALIEYHGINGNRDSLIHYCNKFELLEKRHPNIKSKIIFLTYKGQGISVYWGLDEEAIKYYIEAYELSKKAKSSIGKKIFIKGKIAEFYNHKGEYNKALKLLLDDIKDTVSLSSSYKSGYFLELAHTYQNKKMPSKSIFFNTRVLKLSLKSKDIVWATRARVEIYNDYYLLGNYKQAIDSTLLIYNKLLNNNTTEFRDIKLNAKMLLSSSYKAIGDYKKAIFYLKQVVKEVQKSDSQMDNYEELASCYEANNDLKLAMDTYKKKSVLIDSIRSRERKTFVDYYDNQVKTINIKEAAENIILKNKVIVAENKRQKLYISILLVSLLTAGLLVVLFILGKKYKVTKDKVAVLKKNEVNILKNHIKVRENELSAMLLSEAKKTEQLDQIKTTLSEAVKNNDREQISVAQKSLNQYLKSSEEFGIFSERLESQYPGIVHQLKESHPELSQNDVRHCLLVKLGLSLKESASLLNVTTGTVKNSRNRVVRKLDLPEDVNFKQFLDQIEGNVLENS